MLKLSADRGTKITQIKLYETTSAGEQEEIILNVKHKRVTPDIGRAIMLLVEGITGEQEAYRKNKNLPLNKQKELPPPRSVLIEQLCFIAEDLDILDEESKPLEITPQNLARIDLSYLEAILEGINGTVIPEKKNLSDFSSGMSQVVG